LSWFVQNNNAQTTPSLRSSSGADLKVKPMLDGRYRAEVDMLKLLLNMLTRC